jgi:Flp pilus assembly protein TadG
MQGERVMRDFMSAMRSAMRRFAHEARGTTAMTFALSTPVLLGATALAVDYTDLSSRRQRLQQLADSAALAGAREMRLGNQAAGAVNGVAQNYVNANALMVTSSPIGFSGSVSGDKSSYSVVLTADLPSYVAKSLGIIATSVAAKATAKHTSGPPICVVALDENSNSNIDLNNSSRLIGNGCSIFSNSAKPEGIHAVGGTLVQTSYTCVVGGAGGGGVFSPAAKTGCPKTPDPLAARAAPLPSACDPTKMSVTISGTTTTLYPGIYCNGLRITGGAKVTFAAGVYHIKDGQFWVDGGATITGAYTGFYFTGDHANLRFDQDSTIDLTAPKDGLLAGMLFFQDRKADDVEDFIIDSNNAAKLIGTVYLPKGVLSLNGSQPVGQASAFTIVVAQRIKQTLTSTMTLNTQYNITDVPVPNGLGSNSGAIALVN